jgi:hypothetical protein
LLFQNPYFLKNTITKAILQDKLYSGDRTAIELLYSRYGSMLFGFVIQFTPDTGQAEDLLVNIFSRVASRLQDACDSSLSIYCWLQVEARKIILETIGEGSGGSVWMDLLERASEEQQWVFRELFLKGRQKEALALELSRDGAYVDKLLQESLIILRTQMQ